MIFYVLGPMLVNTVRSCFILFNPVTSSQDKGRSLEHYMMTIRNIILTTYLLPASVEDPTRPPVVGRLRSSPVLS